jgi:hypothetical protein
MKELQKPVQGTQCVGCRNLATKYCEGWDHRESPMSQAGQFSMRVQCGMPVCDSCTHLTSRSHAPKVS